MTELRDRRREETRARILEAVLRLMAEADPASIDMPAVAEASGVSLRTLYRYFPSKGELIEAAGGWFDGRNWARAAGAEGLPDETSVVGYQRARFVDFAANVPGVLAQVTTPAGRDLRRRRLGEFRPATRAIVRRVTGDLDDADVDRLVDGITAVGSSLMFLELVERSGWDPEDAGEFTAWMIEAMVAHASSTGSTRPSQPSEVAP
ncbi:MAG: TetR/AcrR family transcriptional regulator [Actinomycetota bacterium]